MNRPLIMGILNVTPDSFSDGGKFLDCEQAVEHGLKLVAAGADILDIGGESTRPNAREVSVEEEISRVVPVIKKLATHKLQSSIDTRHTATMRAAVEAGATFINDINALQDEGAVEFAASAGVSVCLMHMQGNPQTMQDSPAYKDVVDEVFKFLEQRIAVCMQAGIEKRRIYADVGLGFGKTLEHNLDLLRNLEHFHKLGVKLLLGASRKNFIDKIAGPAPADQRLGGSLASAIWGREKGVHMLRVHDVAETKQALEVWQRLN